MIDASNAVNKVVDGALSAAGIKFSFGQLPELQGSTPGQKSAMAGMFVGSFLMGTGEENSAVKGANVVEEIFKNPKALGNFLGESHAQALGGMLKGLGWDVGTLSMIVSTAVQHFLLAPLVE